ncbi:hypothetical protein ACH5RR_033786 [Cinchona calisaya]|uniref:Aspartic peptidase DDI1-type domain-containing protein n=1 Tax=Cinchona calisaya TaxID=153742 RepID=A0ABD2Y9Y3_9GENT
MLQKNLLTKCKDPRMCTIPYMINNTRIKEAMLDLGASINVMPYSFYVSLQLAPSIGTSIVIQLADRSLAYPKGIVKDVLVQVNELIFPADFCVLDMENNDKSTPILLGGHSSKYLKLK